MAYGVKYIIDFVNLQLRISEKDYVGSSTAIQAGSPATVHAWDVDDPIAPIKGSSLTATIIGVPLLGFYAENDDQFKGELYNSSALLHSGFVVQEDCIEDVDDLDHPVTISITDNLGLLKDVSFGDAIAAKITESKQLAITTSGFNIDIPLTLAIGDKFTIIDSGSNLGTYTILTVVDADSYTTSSTMPALSGTYTIALTQVLTASKISLFAAIQACLRATGLEIPLTIYADLKEDSQNTNSSFFEQTLIARESFLKSEREYISCYDVLEMIMTDFQCTVVQAGGRWVVKRCFELAPGGFIYDSDFARLGTILFSNSQIFGRNRSLYPVYGFNKRILRPYRVVKRTYKYQSLILFQNPDLHNLGAFIGTSTAVVDGVSIRYDDYALTGLINNPANNAFIRIETDTLTDTELDRYVYQPYHGSGSASDKYFTSNRIEVNKDDKIDLSFQYRAQEDSSNYTQYTLGIFLHVDSSNKWALVSSDPDPTHAITELVWAFNPTNTTFRLDKIEGTSDQTQYTNFTLSAFHGVIPNLPVNGLLEFLFGSEQVTPAAKDSITKDFRFTYTAFVNKSVKITGQTHTNTQTIDTKNKNEEDLSLDDAPRNPLKGALFLNTTSGFMQDRTSSWNTGKRLREITAQELKQWRSEPRTIFEGTLIGDLLGTEVADTLVTPITYFGNPAFPTLTFLPGKMELDYANKTCNCTLHEIHRSGEAAIASAYSFEYIYDTK